MTAKTICGNKQVFKCEDSAKKALLKEARCFDCDCKINVIDDEIENGMILSYDDGEEEVFVFKCEKCFQENKTLKDYKECEVYTRIVGYLRPVKQYNPGKQQEYVERKEYKVNEED